MRLINKKKIEKYKRKHFGNQRLTNAIDALISDIIDYNWKSKDELIKSRNDADLVHNDGFYFFNIHIDRTLILLEFDEEEATAVWICNHDEYENTFKNNKRTIKKWLRSNDWI